MGHSICLNKNISSQIKWLPDLLSSLVLKKTAFVFWQTEMIKNKATFLKEKSLKLVEISYVDFFKTLTLFILKYLQYSVRMHKLQNLNFPSKNKYTFPFYI